MIDRMIQEYDKGGSFKEYVDKAAQKDGITSKEEMQKVITKEYYISIQQGVNRG